MDLAVDPVDGTLWASTWRRTDLILTIDKSTGEGTPVGSTGLGYNISGLFFDAEGNLFGCIGRGGGMSEMISIDKTTGVGTVIGPTGFGFMNGAATRLDRSVGVEHEISSSTLPKQFCLEQNFPNPFNPSTTIRYDLPKPVRVKLEIYNIVGRKVRTLVDEDMAAGRKQVLWDARDDAGLTVGSGVYFYRMAAGDFSKTQKMMVIK
jgi:hypothetical protein